MTNEELIAALEAADGPSFTLEQEIFRSINPHATKLSIPNNYTASIDAALMLVPEGMTIGLMSVGDVYHFGIGENDRQAQFYAVASHPAIAICIAALKARGEG